MEFKIRIDFKDVGKKLISTVGLKDLDEARKQLGQQITNVVPITNSLQLLDPSLADFVSTSLTVNTGKKTGILEITMNEAFARKFGTFFDDDNEVGANTTPASLDNIVGKRVYVLPKPEDIKRYPENTALAYNTLDLTKLTKILTKISNN